MIKRVKGGFRNVLRPRRPAENVNNQWRYYLKIINITGRVWNWSSLSSTQINFTFNSILINQKVNYFIFFQNINALIIINLVKSITADGRCSRNSMKLSIRPPGKIRCQVWNPIISISHETFPSDFWNSDFKDIRLKY